MLELRKKLSLQKIEPERDVESLELTATYNNLLERHEVWFEDSESAKVRIDIANTKGINKFSFWRIGGEDEKIWDLR